MDCSGCTWQRTYSIPAPGPHASNFEQMQEVFQKWQASDPKGILDLLTCYPGGAQHLMFFQITARPPNAPSQGMLAAEAQSALLFPTITPHLGPDWSTSANYPMATVNVLEQLWLDPTDFTELQAVADDGIQKVTAVAQPNNVTWDMGDGGPHSVFTCPDAGTPWQNHTMPSGCVYTYRHSSANQPQKDITDPNDRPYHVTVTVDYTITWTCVSDNPDIDPDACGGETGGTVVHHNSADWDLVVGEIQAVNY